MQIAESQPLHNGHLEYLLAAMERCDFLWIGITQFNIQELATSQEAAHRHAFSSNPFTYWQRVRMIEESLVASGVGRQRFGFSPFPIEKPVQLSDFIGTDVVQFTTIVEEWNREKVIRLKGQGYIVEVLWEREAKHPIGAEVRKLLRERNAAWRTMVPLGAQAIIDELVPQLFPN